MAQKNPSRKSNTKSPKVAEQVVADRIIELLDKGELPPWNRPWTINPRGSPCNAINMRPYRGMNVFLTRITQEIMGYEDMRWLSFKQAQKIGGHVRKGEKSTAIVFWKRITKTDEQTGKDETFPIALVYNVFNVEQTENCNLPPLPELPEAKDPIQQAEEIIANMPNPPKFETYGTDNVSPHYIPTSDIVRVPDRRRYQVQELYYNTIYHELTHSTGHPDRLARFQPLNMPNLHEYGTEELIAGMGSAMIADLAGIGHMTIESDASYIKSWSQTIKADKSIVLRSAAKAQKAVDYITNHDPSQAEQKEASVQT